MRSSSRRALMPVSLGGDHCVRASIACLPALFSSFCNRRDHGAPVEAPRRPTTQRFRHWLGTVLLLAAAATAALLVAPATATHFNSGTFSAERTASTTQPATADKITLQFDSAWRWSFPWNDGVYPSVGQTINLGVLEYQFENDVPRSVSVMGKVTAVNAAEDIAYYSSTITLDGNKRIASLVFAQCCRASDLAEGNNDEEYQLKMDVPALVAGAVWRSARVVALPLLYLEQGVPNAFPIPMTSRDNNLTVRPSVAPIANSGLEVARPVGTAACRNPDGASFPCVQCAAEPLNGVCTNALRIDNTGKAVWTPLLAGKYTMQLDVGRYNSVLTRIDSVPYDFIVRVVPPCTAGPPTCMPPPVISFNPTYNATPGQPLSIPIAVSTTVANATLALASTPLSAGMSLSPLYGDSPQMVAQLAWTPTWADAGIHEICFQAQASITNPPMSRAAFNADCLRVSVPHPTVPVAPTILAAFRGNGQVEVRFSPSTFDGGSPITSYKVISNPPGGISPAANSTDPIISRTVTNLVNGTPYTFTAVATNAVGDSPSAPSDTVIPATVPLAPVITSNIIPGDGRVTLFVVENPAPGSNGGMPVTSLTVGSPGGGVDVNAGSVNPSHMVVDLENGTGYQFLAIAMNQVGPSLYSALTPVITPNPSKPQVSQMFAAPAIVFGESTQLTITVTNPNPLSTLSGLAFSNSLPAGITATPASLNLCGGTVTITVNSVALSGGALVADSNCAIPVTVTGAQPRAAAWTNTINNLTTTTTTLIGNNPTSTNQIVVNKASTTTRVLATTPASTVVGQPYDVSVDVLPVAPGAGTPGGSVTVGDGSNQCTVTLPATSCSLPSTSTGPVTLSASFAGDSRFLASVATGVHTINKAASATTITSTSPATTVVGQSYVVNYAVAVVAPGVATPGGSVTISDGSNSCVGTLPATSCTMPSTTATTVSLTATYAGDARLLGSVSPAVAQTIGKASTVVSVTSTAPAATVIGEPYTVNYTIGVTAPGAGTPGGTVTVSDGSNSCVGTLPATSCQLPSTTVGSAAITATYGGEPRYLGSVSAPASHVISKAATTLAIVSSVPSSTVIGQSYAVNFALNVTTPGAGTPGGTVTVSDGSNSCVATLPATSCTLPSMTIGPASLTATYGGDAKFLDSVSAAATHAIAKAATTTTILSASPASSVYGQSYSVTLAVAVTAPGTGTATGTITVSDGSNSCTATLPATSCSLPSTQATTVTLSATYGGDAAFAASVASTQPYTIAKAATSLVIGGAVPAATVVGQPYVVSFVLSVTAPGAGTPTGSVTVSDGSTSCTATLPATSCTLTGTAAGTVALTASYAGDAAFAASTSSVVNQTVARAPTALSIVSDTPDPSAAGLPVVVTVNLAVVAPGSGNASGNIVVSDGVDSCTIALPASSCIWKPATIGERSITASYAGDTRFEGSTSAAAAHEVFAAEQQSLLTVTRAGSGTGAVASGDGQIACGSDCFNAYLNGSAVTLTATPASGSVFTGWLGACSGQLPCALTITAPAEVSATFAPDAPLLTLDVDGNASVELLADGVLLVRYLTLLPDEALVAGAIGGGTPLRVTAAEVRQYLVNMRPLLDVDGDGTVDMASDGVILLRYLAGLRGDALVAGLVLGERATRSVPLDIEKYLATLMP